MTAGVAPSVRWTTSSGRQVVVHAAAGSHAERQAPVELRELERAATALMAVLKVPAPADEPLEVYLVEPVGGGGGDDGGRGDATGPVLRRLDPEQAVPPAWTVTAPLVARWFGPDATGATPILAGLAALAAERQQHAPPLAHADAWVTSELAAGRRPSLLAGAGADADGASLFAPMSFVAFLLRVHGPDALRHYLHAFDPDRRDVAATQTFQKPMGALEEEWLSSLGHGAGAGGSFGTLVRRLLPSIRARRWRWAEIFVLLLLGVVYTIFLPLSSKYLFDEVIPSRDVDKLIAFIAVVAGVFALNTALEVRRAYASAALSQGTLLELQQQVFAALQRLPMRFHGRAKVGDLMSRLSTDVEAVEQATTAVLTQGVLIVLRVVAATITVLVLSPLLGLFVLLIIPLFALSYFGLLSRVQRASREAQRQYGTIGSFTQENLSAQPVVKAYGMEEAAIAGYGSRLQSLYRSILKVVLLGAVFEASVGTAATIGQLLVLGVGGYLVIQEGLSLGTLVAFVALLPTFFEPVIALSGVGQSVQAATGSMERLTEVLEEEPASIEAHDAPALAPLASQLRFESVSFAYDDDGKPVLQDVDLQIAAGEHVAIVGPSGAGKSTIVSLLLRFWDPTAGRITFDATDIREATVASLRDQTAVVFQETFVFDTSVRENIAIARPGASDAEIEEAARHARLDEAVRELPAGYDTVLGERGARLSGGQRQRLAIARALLRDPRVLLLDEATSALDSRTEREIVDAISDAARGRTVISVTHRLGLAALADRIIVLEAGRVVQEGTHDELRHRVGLYRTLHEQGDASGAGATERFDLTTVPLLRELDREALAVVAGRLTRERVVAGVDVVREGEEGDRLYIVERGDLDVLGHAPGTGERVVRTLGGGDFFGEIALVGDGRRTATVRAATDAVLLTLERDDFLALLDENPAAGAAVHSAMDLRSAAYAGALERTGARVLAAPS